MFAVHSWLGFKLCILMTVISATGTLAVVSNEIDWLIDPQLRVEARGEPAGLDALYRSALASHPELLPFRIALPRDPWRAVEVSAYDWQGKLRRVRLDPYSGESRGTHSWITAQRVLRDLHQHLFAAPLGRYVVSAFGFVLLGSLVTGLIAYKKFWRNAFRLRRDRGRRVFWGDLHKLMGLWGLWFVFAIAVTGGWYLLEQAMIDSGNNPDPPRPRLSEERLAALGPAPEMLPLGGLAAIAQREIPGLEVTQVFLPNAFGSPVAVWGQTDAVLVRPRANAVYLDPFDGTVLEVYDARRDPLFTRWVNTADPLHFGDFAGLLSKAIWFVFGVFVTASSVTGAWLYLRRIRPQGRQAAP